MRTMKPTQAVPIGPSSLLGWVGALAGIVVTAVLSLSEHAALLSGPGKWSAILGTVALVGTNFGRQLQAAHLPKAAAIAAEAAAGAGAAGAAIPVPKQPPPPEPMTIEAPLTANTPPPGQSAAQLQQ